MYAEVGEAGEGRAANGGRTNVIDRLRLFICLNDMLFKRLLAVVMLGIFQATQLCEDIKMYRRSYSERRKA